MLKLQIIGSGSSGNCAVLYGDSGIIILDCGMPMSEVKKAINFRVNDIVSAICTHIHGDHAKYIQDFLNMGITVYTPPTVKEKYSDRNAIRIDAMKPFKTGFATFTPFQVPHDDTECFGYYIIADGQKMLWLTDLEYCPMNFAKQKVNTIMCECNYQTDLVDRNEAKSSHVFRGHMSDNTCMEFLRVNKSENLRQVILTHLSAENADREVLLSKARQVVDCDCYIASKGLSVRLDDVLF